jgi:hypothetical protein
MSCCRSHSATVAATVSSSSRIGRSIEGVRLGDTTRVAVAHLTKAVGVKRVVGPRRSWSALLPSPFPRHGTVAAPRSAGVNTSWRPLADFYENPNGQIGSAPSDYGYRPFVSAWHDVGRECDRPTPSAHLHHCHQPKRAQRRGCAQHVATPLQHLCRERQFVIANTADLSSQARWVGPDHNR